jgi:hypothetical protein
MPTLPNLPDSIARETFATLCSLLPPPANDTPETRADRAETAMQAVADLRPANAFEADLAAHIVGHIAHANDALRQAAEPGLDPQKIDRCRAQSTAMGRQALAALRVLRRQRPDQAKPEPVTLPAPPNLSRLTEVEKYAVTYPDRAMRIRAAGALPNPCNFDPPRHSLVRAIVTSNSPLLRALDLRGTLAA